MSGSSGLNASLQAPWMASIICSPGFASRSAIPHSQLRTPLDELVTVPDSTSLLQSLVIGEVVGGLTDTDEPLLPLLIESIPFFPGQDERYILPSARGSGIKVGTGGQSMGEAGKTGASTVALRPEWEIDRLCRK